MKAATRGQISPSWLSVMLDNEENQVISKHEKLKEILQEMQNVVIAYSGGVDSALLAKVANDVLGERALCVISTSKLFPTSETEEGISLAHSLKLNLMQIDTDVLCNETFLQNTPERCYFCKTELFIKLFEIAADRGIPWVADGSNLDDTKDYRPGSKAVMEFGVRSPLKEAGFTKADIRQLSKELGLPTWDKPAFACLSTRIPYGSRIREEILQRLESAEAFLRSLGFRQLRVRHHDTIARIELDPADLSRAVDSNIRDQIVSKFEGLGYLYVVLDLAGYRMGSMNKELAANDEGGV